MRRAWLLLALGGAIGCSDEVPQSVPLAEPVPTAPASAAATSPRVTDRIPTARGELVVVPLEGASILLGWNGETIYIDPTSKAIADESLPVADVVLVTDIHFDHLDAVAVSRLRRPGTVVVGPPSVAARTPVDVVLPNGASQEVRGLGVSAIAAYNATRGPVPGLVYHPRGRGNGYVLDLAGTRVYVSGDTDCTSEVRALERIDLAFVGIRPPYTMDAAEATACLRAFKPRIALPYYDPGLDADAFVRDTSGDGVEVRARQFYPRPAKLRAEAVEACAHERWGRCEELLDRAKLLDPAGESDSRVQRARADVAHGKP